MGSGGGEWGTVRRRDELIGEFLAQFERHGRTDCDNKDNTGMLWHLVVLFMYRSFDTSLSIIIISQATTVQVELTTTSTNDIIHYS